MTIESNKSKANKTSFKKGTSGNPSGRLKKEIDLNLVEELCKINCTQAEICQVLEVDDKTLNARLKDAGHATFSQFFNKKALNRTISKRRKIAQIEEAQFDVAIEERNVPMLIWLGKQYLGQKEPIRVEAVPIVDEAAREAHAKHIEDNSRCYKLIARIMSDEELSIKDKEKKLELLAS